MQPEHSIATHPVLSSPLGGTLSILASFLLWMLGTPACSSVEQHSLHGSSDKLKNYSTYAWSAATPSVATDPSEVQVSDQMRKLVDQRLQALGFRELPPAEAELRLAQQLSIEVLVREMDPYFSFDTARRSEHGRITLEFEDAHTGELLWSTAAERTLRDTARGYGLLDVRWEPLEQERDWKLEEMANRLCSGIPARTAEQRAP